jgi:hypothetical protein
MRLTEKVALSFVLVGMACALTARAADEPKPTPGNTVSVHLAEPVPPQKFNNPPKFWIKEMADRSGNPQPMLVLHSRGGIFLDRQPIVIVREALEESLKSANLLAGDADSGDLVIRVYLFHFGLAEGSGLDFFGKVEFSAIVKNPKTGETAEVKASGTSIAKGAARKKNIQKNVQENLEESLRDAIRNFLRGQQLKDAVTLLWKSGEGTPAAPAKPEEKPQ